MRLIRWSPSLHIQTLEPSGLKLIFSKKISLPIFTGSKITDVENSSPPNPSRGHKKRSYGSGKSPSPNQSRYCGSRRRLPPGDRDNWTSEEFDSSIVKERTGKRPLLTGEANI
ncbi:hypothetical protein Q3G72_004462 [Acer saccharum]|nr:hypothetical protein Q3G72_004462 [Acer saccharum]